ncbi:hypothetical protein MYX82_06435 [Acidobacteria bacterium AH-259-D05]|nr:hypothetical protein [Acidobacteria bacterium AH-259-D05]
MRKFSFYAEKIEILDVIKDSNALASVKLGGSLFFPNEENLYEYSFHKGQGLEVRLHVVPFLASLRNIVRYLDYLGDRKGLDRSAGI